MVNTMFWTHFAKDIKLNECKEAQDFAAIYEVMGEPEYKKNVHSGTRYCNTSITSYLFQAWKRGLISKEETQNMYIWFQDNYQLR